MARTAWPAAVQATRLSLHFFAEAAPILRVAQEDVPMPYNERLEKAVLPSTEKLIAAVHKVCYS